MSYGGYLVYQHQMNELISIVAAAGGSFTGMTVAYWIGFKMGYPFFQRYGHRFHLGPERLEKTSMIFKKHGLKFLLVACFIPGIRHITGYFSGITQVRYRSFAVFSGIGALLWTTTFIYLGKLLGPQWRLIETSAKKYMVIFIILLITAVVVVYLIRINLERIKTLIVVGWKAINATYRSQTRLKLLITAAAVVFIIFLSSAIGLIQDLISRGFGEFNQVTLLILKAAFNEEWATLMTIFYDLSSAWALVITAVLTTLWIILKGKNRWLELWLFLLLLSGGLVYMGFMNFLFRTAAAWLHWSMIGVSIFPNDKLIMTVTVYGFFAFLLSRHITRYRLKILATILVLFVLFAVGISHVYFNLQLPSSIMTGYVFGGVWLSFIVLLLETLRLIKISYADA
jgi:membrane protein DedA with SNARE-associated domain